MKQGRSLKDAKAERAAKKRRAMRRKRSLVLLIEVLVLASLIGTGYVLTKYKKIQQEQLQESDIQVNEGAKQEKYRTVALFGVDSREGEMGVGTYADTIMIATIDKETKEIKLVSVYRDLLTMQLNRRIGKANQSYFNGGPLETINMLNKNLDLDVKDYITVDFKAMAGAVDLLGGIEVYLSENEAGEINRYIDETAMVVGKDAKRVKEGKQTLDGVQTVTYARVGKNISNDYGRTECQRLIVEKLIEKIKHQNVMTLDNIINQVFPQVATSFTLEELLGLTADVMQYNLSETRGYPFEKTEVVFEKVQNAVIPAGSVENIEELHEFLYPKNEYEVSETVKETVKQIDGQIQNKE